jgi:hypothetical protein
MTDRKTLVYTFSQITIHLAIALLERENQNLLFHPWRDINTFIRFYLHTDPLSKPIYRPK